MEQKPLFPSPIVTSKAFVEFNKNKPKKKKKKEEKIQLSLSKYARTKYPDLIFQVDIASGMRLTIGQGLKAKMMRSERGQPDFVCMEPRGTYYAFCLELKNKVSDVYLKDGLTISDAPSNSHVREQALILKRLRAKNYYAEFGFGLEDCIKKLDTYMAL